MPLWKAKIFIMHININCLQLLFFYMYVYFLMFIFSEDLLENCLDSPSVSITWEEIVSVKLHYNLLWTLRHRGWWDIVAILYWFLIFMRKFLTTKNIWRRDVLDLFILFTDISTLERGMACYPLWDSLFYVIAI